MVVQATRLFAPMSRAAFSSANGVSRASSEIVTGWEARKVLSVSSYHRSNRPCFSYSGQLGSPAISSRRRPVWSYRSFNSLPTNISSRERSPHSTVYDVFRMTPLSCRPSSSLSRRIYDSPTIGNRGFPRPRKPGGSGCSVTDVFDLLWYFFLVSKNPRHASLFFRITCWAVDAPRTPLYLPSRRPVSASHTSSSSKSSSSLSSKS